MIKTKILAAALCLTFTIGIGYSYAADSEIDHALENLRKAKSRIEELRALASQNTYPGADNEKLKEASEKLSTANILLNDESLREISVISNYLQFKKVDYLLDSATVDARQGNLKSTINSLEKLSQGSLSPLYAAYIRGNKYFGSVKDDPQVKDLIRKFLIPGKMGSSSVLATKYKENLTNEEKVAGLSLFWAEARRSFVYFDKVPDFDLDKAYLDYLKRVTDSQSTEEYYATLMRFAPLFKNSHTNIYPPSDLLSRFYATPAISTKKVQNKIIVSEIYGNGDEKKIKAGDEIIEIDGIPSEQYVASNISPYQSSSTKQDLIVRNYSYGLLAGDERKKITLGMANLKGEHYSVIISRHFPNLFPPRKNFQFSVNSDGISYFKLSNFTDGEAGRQMESHMAEIMASRGLILDLRENGGGNTNDGLEVLSYLTKEKIPQSSATERSESNYMRAKLDIIALNGNYIPANYGFKKSNPSVFLGPVVVLIGPRTFSAAEDFLGSFCALKRGILIGEQTGGGTGQPIRIDLPGGGFGRISVKRDSTPDGKEIDGYGIKPDIEIRETLDDIRNGHDRILDKAYDYLRHQN